MSNNTKKNYKLDDSEILHVLAAIEFRIDYYVKRLEAIDKIKDQLQNYAQTYKDAEMSKDYFISLRDNLTAQQNKGEKLKKMNDVMAKGIDV